MTTWYKFSAQKNINEHLKTIIKNNKFIKKMFDLLSVPLNRIDKNLTFQFKDLKGKKALSDSKTIVFDKELFEGKITLEENIHYLIHELYHWIKRQKEQAFYFADPEEVEAFILGMTYEILRGVPEDKIAEIYYPIIEDHFAESKDAKKMFNALFSSARKKVKNHELA